jgi:tetratricopeptide (TPR) repeat protein
MKTIKNYLSVFLSIFLIVPLNLAAQVKEVPVTTSSKDALKLFESGRDKFEDMQFHAASTLFDQAIQQDPSFAMAYVYRAQTGGGYNIVRENVDKAVSLEDKVSPGEKLEIEFAQAMYNGDVDKQKEYIDQLLTAFPSDKRVQILAGSYEYSVNDFRGALDHLKKATEIDGNYAPAYNMIGYCQSALNNFPEAEKAFQTYIKMMPDQPNPYDSYAELLLKEGKYDESIAQYKKALEKDPTFTSSLAGIGNNYVFKQDFTSARNYYQQDYDNSPMINGKLDALYLKAVSFVYEGKTADASSTFDEYRSLAEANNLVPNEINSYAFEGFAVSEGGNPSEGMKDFEKAQALFDKSTLPPAIKEQLTTGLMLWHSYFLTANNDLDKANSELEKCKTRIAVRNNPEEQMHLNSLLGFYDIKKGNYDEAIKYLSQADKQDPWNWYYTAMAYNKKGDKKESEQLFSKISKCNVTSINLAVVRKPAMDELKVSSAGL